MTNLHDIKLVSFDVDDTLWDFMHMMHAGLDTILAEIVALGDGYAHLTRDAFSERYMALVPDYDPATAPWNELRRRLLQTVLTEGGHPDAEEYSHDLVARYLDAWRANLRFFPGARETLAALQERYTLAWSTNGDHGPELGALTEYFDVIAMPATTGVAKPDAAFLHYVAEQADVPPAAMMHVGDSLRSDVVGAQNVGAVAVWFNPARRPNETDITPDYEIHALSEVLDLLGVH